MRVTPFQLISSGAMGTSLVSSVMDLQQVWIYSLQAYWTGSPTGELKLQASNDITPIFTAQDVPFFAPTHWSDISGTVASTTAIGSANYLWNVSTPAYRWARLVYTASTAAGTLVVNAVTKGY